LEFGAGGSTVWAAQIVPGNCYAIDSSIEWLDKVAANAGKNAKRVHLEFVDIGPIKEWGYPVDETCKEKFPDYSTSVWKTVDANEIDLFLVDGRFRVACFAECVKRARADAILLIHDYVSRPHYHVVEKIAKLVSTTDDLAVFSLNGSSQEAIAELADRYRCIAH